VAVAFGATAFAAITLWMFFSARPEWPMVILCLYLGLLDGFLKLRTGSSFMTLARDVLLYAIALGILARAALRRERVALPPLSGWVCAFVALVLVQLFNPRDGSVLHSLGALRPHLEFVPLFFLGYQVMRTPKRLTWFIVILSVCAFANGIVNIVQFNLSPAQLASWGPGYAADVNGTGNVSGRVFLDSSGQVKVRPFGLGGDSGAGAEIGLLSIAGAVALLMLAPMRRGFLRWIAIVLAAGPPLAVFTGQGRSIVLGSLVALVYFVVLTTSGRRLIPVMCSLVLGAVIVFAVVGLASSSTGGSIFSRYLTITPGNLTHALQTSRGGSIAQIPDFFVHFPLGGGLGSVGPASDFAGGAQQHLNGETQITFYISELGDPGLLLMLGFNLLLLLGIVRRVRRMPYEARVLTASVAAGLAGLFAQWAAGSTTASSPGAPYFWFAAGVLAFWVFRRESDQTSLTPASTRTW
jgi:hypothetical protein